MNLPASRVATTIRVAIIAIVLLLPALADQTVRAAPGAHGPDGEHLDAAPSAPGRDPGLGTAPRFETLSETFELVGRLQGDGLSLLINRFETSEPVFEARVDVQTGEASAGARFRAGPGDYVIEDAAMLDRLRGPGDHPLVITVIAGEDSDLLDATLSVAPPAGPAIAGARSARTPGPGWLLAAAAAGMVVVLLVTAGWRSARLDRRRGGGMSPGILALATLLALSALGAGPSRAAPGAHGPDGEHLDAQPVVSAGGLMRLPDGSVSVPIQSQRRLGLRTLMAVRTQAAVTVELAGRVVMDPNAGGLVQAGQGGRVEAGPQGFPIAGQRVSQGEILGWIRYHPDPYARSDRTGQLAELKAGRELARQRLRRLESLEGTVARKEIDAARTDLKRLVERERGIAASLDDREALVAPVAGTVVQARAVAGLVVEPRERLFEIVDPSRLMVEAVTADPTLPARLADASILEAPGNWLDLAGAGGALRDGVLPVLFRFRPGTGSPAPALTLDQPVTVIARLAERLDGYVLPARAVVRNPANEPVVWIKAGAERFIPQPVRYQMLDATTVIVIGGLGADNRVAVEGASLLAQIR